MHYFDKGSKQGLRNHPRGCSLQLALFLYEQHDNQHDGRSTDGTDGTKQQLYPPLKSRTLNNTHAAVVARYLPFCE